MRTSLLHLLVVVCFLPGCQAAAPPPTTAPASTPAPAANTAEASRTDDATELRDAIQQPIDKAKATEDATLKAAEDQRKQIEDAGG